MYTLVVRRLPTPAEAWKSGNPLQVSIMGSMVAEWELLYQLAACGSAESIVVLVPRMDDEVEATVAQFPNQNLVRALPADRFHELRALRNVVVFTGGAMITDAAHIRAAYGDPQWVVSGITHAVSSYVAVRQFLLLHLHWMQPYDSLICTSTAGRTAVGHLFGAIEQYLASRLGRHVTCPVQLPLIPLPAPRFEWPLVPRGPAREALGLPADPIVFMYFGRFSDHMKADLRPLLIAFSKLCARGRDAVLVLAGDNRQGQAASLQALAGTLGIANRVYLRTDPTASVKALLYSAADVFVSLSDSLQETFGLTLLEAMQAGLPVLASDWSGYRDIVQPGTTGFLVPTYWADCVSSLGPTAPLSGEKEPNWAAAQTVAVDIPAAVGAMDRLAADPDLRRRMGEAGRAVVQTTFSGEAIVRQYEEVWDASLAMSWSTAPTSQSAEALMSCDYFRHFGHYASHHVSASTVFSLSDLGGRLPLETLETGSLVRDRGGFERSRLRELLALVSERKSGSVADILGDHPDERDVRHLLRLAKHGLLAIGAPAQRSAMIDDTSDELLLS